MRRPERDAAGELHGVNAVVEGATTIHVTSGGGPPLHVALLCVDGRRVFARLDRAPRDEAPPEEILAGATVKLLVKDDGDQYFQVPPGRSIDLGGLVQSIRRRLGA